MMMNGEVELVSEIGSVDQSISFDIIKFVVIHGDFTWQQILRLACVSRAFRRATENSLLWRVLAEKNGYLPQDVPEEKIRQKLLNTVLLLPLRNDCETRLRAVETLSSSLFCARNESKMPKVFAPVGLTYLASGSTSVGFCIADCGWNCCHCCSSPIPACITFLNQSCGWSTLLLLGPGTLLLTLTGVYVGVKCGIEQYQFRTLRQHYFATINELNPLIEKYGFFDSVTQQSFDDVEWKSAASLIARWGMMPRIRMSDSEDVSPRMYSINADCRATENTRLLGRK